MRPRLDRSSLTVIVPVRDEAAQIQSTLRRLLAQTYAEPFRLIVACNGCSDGTAEGARRLERCAHSRGVDLVVLESSTPGKANALNFAEQHACHGARVYVDADVVLSPNALAAIAGALQPDSGVHLCAPTRRIAPLRSMVSRAYARVWSALPYIANGPTGTGIYAVSREGRMRWSRFPPIHSDDKFVRSLFTPAETRILAEATVEVRIPEGGRALLRSRLRWCQGNSQLNRTLSLTDRIRAAHRRYKGIATTIGTRPDLWPCLPIFAAVYLAARGSALVWHPPHIEVWRR